jgi:hypothetical protein
MPDRGYVPARLAPGLGLVASKFLARIDFDDQAERPARHQGTREPGVSSTPRDRYIASCGVEVLGRYGHDQREDVESSA